MDSQKHVELLAYGLGNDMLSEIRNEVDSIQSTLGDLSIASDQLRPESQFALKRISAYIQEAEKITASLSNYERRIIDLQRHPGIVEISELEEQLRQTASRNEIARIKRQLSHAKSLHSRKISDLISVQQQLLHERLRMVTIWKSILNYEIHILEDCKNRIVQNIVAMANSSGDGKTIEMVRERLRSLSVKDCTIDGLKVDMADLHVANIHVLQKALLEHLNDIGKIETMVDEKRQVVQILSSIVKDIREQIPSAPPEEPLSFSPVPKSPESSKNNPPDSPPPPSNARMAYQK